MCLCCLWSLSLSLHTLKNVAHNATFLQLFPSPISASPTSRSTQKCQPKIGLNVLVPLLQHTACEWGHLVLMWAWPPSRASVTHKLPKRNACFRENCTPFFAVKKCRPQSRTWLNPRERRLQPHRTLAAGSSWARQRTVSVAGDHKARPFSSATDRGEVFGGQGGGDAIMP